MPVAEEFEVVLKLLVDAGPLSMDALLDRCPYSRWQLNVILTDLSLHGRVRSAVVKVKNRKVTQYAIKESPHEQ